jgi:GDPmannose 4,6-dehydratase
MKALICGISGQDGAYLAELLLRKGYQVFGTSRDALACSFGNLKKLGIANDVELLSMAPGDFRSVFQAVRLSEPDEIYNLSGQSSVGLSFEQPVETLESIAFGTVNILETIRLTNRDIKFYNAGSGECFGNAPEGGACEETPFRPRSPYAVAKSTAFWQVANYREAYNLFAGTGILFNHESPLRPERFVTQKIICAVKRIAAGSGERLKLGNTEVKRDWGWAPEYVEAMWRILQQEKPDDFVIGTGESHSIADFAAAAFQEYGLNWLDYTDVEKSFFRPSDIMLGRANPQKAERILGWKAEFRMKDVIKNLIAV